jgi:hypothetical protein
MTVPRLADWPPASIAGRETVHLLWAGPPPPSGPRAPLAVAPGRPPLRPLLHRQVLLRLGHLEPHGFQQGQGPAGLLQQQCCHF